MVWFVPAWAGSAQVGACDSPYRRVPPGCGSPVGSEFAAAPEPHAVSAAPSTAVAAAVTTSRDAEEDEMDNDGLRDLDMAPAA